MITGRDQIERNRYVVITARVHSSETPGSYKIQSIIKFLVSNNPIAESLRNELIFLIFPMLNPDGVVIGNNRCSIGGYDLNRCWGDPCLARQPEIYVLKQTLQSLTTDGKQIFVYCDLHGHSKLMNSFIYACYDIASGNPSSWTRVRLLPRVLARKCHLFDYHQCIFKVEANKLSTARVIVWKEFKVINSFTLETSIYAYTLGEEIIIFSERDYFRIGEELVISFYDYLKLLKDLQVEMDDMNDYLRPGRLVKLTGIPAADLFKMEIKEDKANKKKKERFEKHKNRYYLNSKPFSFKRTYESIVYINIESKKGKSRVTNKVNNETEITESTSNKLLKLSVNNQNKSINMDLNKYIIKTKLESNDLNEMNLKSNNTDLIGVDEASSYSPVRKKQFNTSFVKNQNKIIDIKRKIGTKSVIYNPKSIGMVCFINKKLQVQPSDYSGTIIFNNLQTDYQNNPIENLNSNYSRSNSM